MFSSLDANTNNSKAIVLLWFSVACFWCQCFGDVSPYICQYHFLALFGFLIGHLLKKLLTRLSIFSLCILTIRYFSYFPFGFEGGILVLIAPVPGHCILDTVVISILNC